MGKIKRKHFLLWDPGEALWYQGGSWRPNTRCKPWGRQRMAKGRSGKSPLTPPAKHPAHIRDLPKLHSWTFPRPVSHLKPEVQPKVSTGSSPRDHTPVLWAFASCCSFDLECPQHPALAPNWPWLRPLPQGWSHKVPLLSRHWSVCSSWVKSPEDRESYGLSLTSLWSFSSTWHRAVTENTCWMSIFK